MHLGTSFIHPNGLVIVAILFGSALLTMKLARWLPAHHVNAETRSVVTVVMGVVATLSALVVGLLISTANIAFTDKTHDLSEISANVISLDRLLLRYGPEAQDARVLLRRYVVAKLHDLFPKDESVVPNAEHTATVALLEQAQTRMLELQPSNDVQRWLQSQALQLSSAIMASRWLLAQESGGGTPGLLLVLLLFWFVIIFMSFGLFAPWNPTAIAAIFLCSVGIGTAILTTDELQSPIEGLIRISGTPLVHALEVISADGPSLPR